MRIAILGSTGQIGTYVCDKLRTDYPEAEILACSRQKKEGYFQFDPFTDPWSKPGKIDVLINSIGIIRETKNMDFKKVHEGLTKLIVQNRETLGNPKVIQLSVLGADRNSVSPFQHTKAKADELLLSCPDTVVVRPSIVCTPGTMIVQKFKMLKKLAGFTGGYLPFPAKMLRTKIQPVMGTDLAAFISALAGNNVTGCVEIGGPEQISIAELLEKALGVKPLKINQQLADALIPLIGKLFPALISTEQFNLLKKDNIITDPGPSSFLKKDLQSTWDFWKQELA